MLTSRFAITALTAALLSACASEPARTGNPFDERLAAPEANPTKSSYEAGRGMAKPQLQSAPQPAIQAVPLVPAGEAVVVTTPAQAATYSPDTSVSQPLYPQSLDSAQSVMVEARRLGAMGDREAMLELMKQSAYMGNNDALYELARIHQNGDGVPKDQTTAIAYLTTADGRGHFESSRVLAWIYLLGIGIPADRDYAVMLFEKAQAGSVRAKREYGMLLTNLTKPGLDDFDKGTLMLAMAADAGDGESAYRLGQAYESRNRMSEAATYKTRASSLGYTASVPATPLASSATPAAGAGAGAGADLKAEQVKVKALSGDVDAIYRYANGLLLGKYPSIDSEFDAYCWFSVAQERGHPRAKSELAAIQGVKSVADAKTPGRMDRCISDLQQAIAI